MSRPPGQVKNRAPAPIQISAEQIVREAADRQDQDVVVEPIVKIHDAEEYQAHLRDRRKHYEDNIRYRREDIGNWVKYAKFEEENKDLERARSVFERALEVVDSRSGELWLRYAELELRNECINHARNILDRSVQLLPRIDFLWYKYVYVEEMMQDIPKCRAVFERWMKWMPHDNAWLSYARFETRTGSLDRAEVVLRRYANAYPCARSFLRFAKWAEYEAKNIPLARTIYEALLSELEPEETRQARVFKQFAAFEERQGEYERARVIYQHAVKLLNLGEQQQKVTNIDTEKMEEDENDELSDWETLKREELYKSYITFEKKYGDRQSIESVILTKQRAQYNHRLEQDPYDYDGWFELTKLEEEHGSTKEAVRDTFERAVAQVPPSMTNKDDWRRYIYLWIYYAVYEELSNHDLDRASQVYETCLQLIPHKHFSFSKIWIYAAKLHVRRRNVTAARKLLGKAIGMCGKERIFQEYISLELSLGEIDRCRALYTNYVKAMPFRSQAWSNYAQLEASVGETERTRAIYELGVSQPSLDRPEWLWKAYIDFEIKEGEDGGDKARKLYHRLLEKTNHVKVWISLAQFEGTTQATADGDGGVGGIEAARATFQKAYDQLKQDKNLNEDRVLLLDAWRAMEQVKGDARHVSDVEARMPRRIKRKRMRQDEQGNELGWEEYFDYQFPDDNADSAAAGNFKILEMAAKWKEQNAAEDDDDSDLDSD